MAQKIQAKVGDKLILEFPEDTPDSIIDGEVQARLKEYDAANAFSDVKGGSSSTAPPKRVASQAFYGQQDEHKNAKEVTPAKAPDFNSPEFRDYAAGDPEGAAALRYQYDPETKPRTAAYQSTLKALPVVGAAIAAPEAVASAGGGTILQYLAGALTPTLVDKGIKAASGDETPTSIYGGVSGTKNPVADIAAGTAENLIIPYGIGKVVQGGARLASGMKSIATELKDAGSVRSLFTDVGQTASNFEGAKTYAQLPKTNMGPVGRISKPVAEFVGNFLSPESRAAVAESQINLARKDAESFIQSTTKNKIDLTKSMKDTSLPEVAAIELENAKAASVAESASQVEQAGMMARHPENTAYTVIPPQELVDDAKAAGRAAPQAQTFYGSQGRNAAVPYLMEKWELRTTEGAMQNANATKAAAVKLVNSGLGSKLEINGGDAAVSLAGDIMAKLQNEIPPAYDQLRGWKFQAEQILENLPQNAYNARAAFGKLLNALDRDLAVGINSLPENAKGVLEAHNIDNGLTRQRLALFEGGGALSKVSQLDPNNLASAGPFQEEVADQIRKVLQDKHQLNRALNSGTFDVNFPTVNGFRQIPVTSSTSLKRALTGFAIQDLLDSKAPGEFLNALNNDSTINKTFSQLMSKSELEGFQKVLGQFDQAAYNPAQGMSKWVSVRTGLSTGVGLTQGLSRYLMGSGGTAAASTGIAGGTFLLGGHNIAKLLNNPRTSRVFQAFMTKAPLEMSDRAAMDLFRAALVGTRATLQNQDGSSKDYIFTRQGVKPAEASQ